MKNINVEINQNAEVSVKLPIQKSVDQQLLIMEKYTETHKKYTKQDKDKREIECLKVIFPTLFRTMEPGDLIYGRLDFLPIGFGAVTSLGGVGHYCVFKKLSEFKENFQDEKDLGRIDALYNYWLDHDIKTKYVKDVINDDTIGAFIDTRYPMIATARLSGVMLDYEKLIHEGVIGIKNEINMKLSSDPENKFLKASLEAMILFENIIDHAVKSIETQMVNQTGGIQNNYQHIIDDLKFIKNKKPQTFHQALQLYWLYAMVAGCINYGRLDDVLGPYLYHDVQSGLISEERALEYLKSLWTMIENRRTTVNGRIIVGGKGRKHVKEADYFAKLALQVTHECKYVEPQFTYRVDEDTTIEQWDNIVSALADGVTYPTLYNDEINIPAVQYAMRVDEETAQQYAPFGCGEFIIQGQSIGTPNVCLNLLKMLNMTLNEGVDPFDGKHRIGSVDIPHVSEYKTFEDLYDKYKEVLDYFATLSVEAQVKSYEIMNEEVSFIYSSIMMNDCIERGKPILDGGIKILGGTNETYGNINASDSLTVINELVYKQKKYTLEQLVIAANTNYEGYEELTKDVLDVPKYGNDLEEPDNMANDLYEYLAQSVRTKGIEAGLDYYLIVISNNQVNTEWGRKTSASVDGRLSGMFMNPANNPQSGAAFSGPTATLNSLAKFDAKYHGGSVQNMKFSKPLMKGNKEKIRDLIKVYFKKGGCQLMVTSVDKGELEDAKINPQNHKDLVVRVSGFSAIFINLDSDVQDEVISRVLYE